MLCKLRIKDSKPFRCQPSPSRYFLEKKAQDRLENILRISTVQDSKQPEPVAASDM